MKRTCTNAYKMARQAAGMTQMKASRALCVDLRTLQHWESGERVPPKDIRFSMAELYDAPQLRANPASPGAATNLFLKELDDVLDLRRELQAITCDDEISQNERARWAEICRELHEAAYAGMALINI